MVSGFRVQGSRFRVTGVLKLGNPWTLEVLWGAEGKFQ